MTEIEKRLKDKSCKNCLMPLNVNNIKEYDVLAAQYLCKKCRKLKDEQKYQDRRELIRERQRVQGLSIKIKVIEGYGSQCICCGENRIQFLTLKQLGGTGKLSGKLYRQLIIDNFPVGGCQVLCYNCICAIDTFGVCPHKQQV